MEEKLPTKTPKRKVAVFDIDGTFFRSSLLIELVEVFVQKGIFPSKTSKIYQPAYKKWRDRKESYENYIASVIKAFDKNIDGVDCDKFVEIADKVASVNQNYIYCYTRDLVKELKNKGYFILAISHSPWGVLEKFCKKNGFDKVYGRFYKVNTNGKLTSTVEHEKLISDKAKILMRALEKENLTLKKSIGVGDTESDIPFLKIVEKPICFNPNKKLYDYAKNKKWKVIIERKDMIYHI
ncbi:HAD-IB family hydrolase [Candidatus Wolfebacteria bacterium CG10_big_fil_rev_8_21_14_0_10_31_9]|uniref:phosphoserine phosphatase n=1 Tax=Candidatus Wolfebacteria bacterium CG10_big_fil_rev_8_21_14_0_10_31_9 TaxID=1975070 RepID=A0A2H0RDZ7_9BACT|nr:MAG: HAD-IB family hydrolase [Candidatus Wolfebacteria bacterium CG10_big_fil_rev_8_21_14_0_10_31_9]